MSYRRIISYQAGRQLSYAEYGDETGYPVLIQHGLIASIDDFHLFDRLLQQRIRLICIARPGYGDSSPYLLESFAEWGEIVSPLIHELNLSQFDILGMSSGAPYSYSIGYRFPDQVGHIFILSGIPALYDEAVRAEWPYPPVGDQSMDALQELARQLFFSHVTEKDLQQSDIRDSLRNQAFGVAQDLRLRFIDWGFHLSDVKSRVFMRHSKQDESVPFRTAVRTSELLPDCHLELLEEGPHFSNEGLDHFLGETVIPNIRTASLWI